VYVRRVPIRDAASVSAALLSVLNARRTLPDGREALYFVHGLDGRIHVNADYAAHLRDVARYR